MTLQEAPAAKPAEESATTLSEVLPGSGFANLDELIDLFDLAAGRTAYTHVRGPVVTASFERIRLHSPISRGVHLRVTARVVSTGKSSLLLRIVAEAEDPATRRFHPLADAYSTFVSVAAGAPAPLVPALKMSNSDGDAAKAELSAARKRFKVADKKLLEPPVAEDYSNAVPVAETVVVVQKQYLPRHKNFGEMVFGGDLLETVTRVATYAAKRVVPTSASSSNVTALCLAVRHFSFIVPISPMDLWCIAARVTAVRDGVVYVEVRAAIDGKKAISHDAMFAIALVDDCSKAVQAAPIDYHKADDEALAAYARTSLWMEEERLDTEVFTNTGC